jgi:hypothetical protein
VSQLRTIKRFSYSAKKLEIFRFIFTRLGSVFTDIVTRVMVSGLYQTQHITESGDEGCMLSTMATATVFALAIE